MYLVESVVSEATAVFCRWLRMRRAAHLNPQLHWGVKSKILGQYSTALGDGGSNNLLIGLRIGSCWGYTTSSGSLPSRSVGDNLEPNLS